MWSEILAELQAGLIDVVCTAATYTPERAQRFDYGRPYLDMALAVVARTDDESIASVGDARGRSFAVRIATTAEDYIRSELAPVSVETFEYNVDTYDALVAGRGDVVVDDSPIAAWFVNQRGRLRLVGDLPGTDSHYAMMFARGSSLRASIDAQLEHLHAAGTLKAWQKRWFGDRGAVSR